MEQTQPIEERHSVKFAINAKQQWSAEVKCYGLTPDEAKKRTCKLASEIEVIIKEKNEVK